MGNNGVFKTRLKNGMTVILKEAHVAPVTTWWVWYRVGSRNERTGLTGASHWVEHMMFKGTRKFPAGLLDKAVSRDGGVWNAMTWIDWTAYFETMPADKIDLALRLEADRMRNLTLPAREFDKEIKVVREERRLRTEDEPESYASEVAMATAYQSSPYRQPVIGWMADLEAMRVDDLKTWYRRWYAPNIAIVVVAGDVQPEAVQRLARKYFGALRPEATDTPDWRPEVPQQGIKRATVKRPAEVPLLIMAWKAPVVTATLRADAGVEPWEPYALEVLSGILDGGSSARFATRLVRGQEVAAGIGSDYQFGARL
ncbi:MAG: pitrilysin family protein, partial [Chloroflexota bacterium]